MKGEVISDDGTAVRYDKLKHSTLFDQFKRDVAALRDIDLKTLSENEKMAFFISILDKSCEM